jgi:hypothetical protein
MVESLAEIVLDGIDRHTELIGNLLVGPAVAPLPQQCHAALAGQLMQDAVELLLRQFVAAVLLHLEAVRFLDTPLHLDRLTTAVAQVLGAHRIVRTSEHITSDFKEIGFRIFDRLGGRVAQQPLVHLLHQVVDVRGPAGATGK